jgi:hypothetical protein
MNGTTPRKKRSPIYIPEDLKQILISLKCHPKEPLGDVAERLITLAIEKI